MVSKDPCRLEPYDVIIRWVERFPAAGGAGRSRRAARVCRAPWARPSSGFLRVHRARPTSTAGPGRMRQTFNVGQDSHIGPLVSF